MTIIHTNQKIVKDIPIEQERWCGYKPMLRPWFCAGGCRAAYREDRRHGLIYGSVLMPFDSGNERIVGHHDSCRWTHRCPYCGADKPQKEREQHTYYATTKGDTRINESGTYYRDIDHTCHTLHATSVTDAKRVCKMHGLTIVGIVEFFGGETETRFNCWLEETACQKNAK